MAMTISSQATTASIKPLRPSFDVWFNQGFLRTLDFPQRVFLPRPNQLRISAISSSGVHSSDNAFSVPEPSPLPFQVTGDPGKMVAVQRNLRKFGIKELARTGKIALRREKMGESAPFWRFSAASYPDLEGTLPAEAMMETTNGVIKGDLDISKGECLFHCRGIYISSLIGVNSSTKHWVFGLNALKQAQGRPITRLLSYWDPFDEYASDEFPKGFIL